MKTIQEAGPTELEAVRRRTIRTLAMGEISKSDCDFINNHIDAILNRLANTKED